MELERAGEFVRDFVSQTGDLQVHGAKGVTGPTRPVLYFDGTTAYLAARDAQVDCLELGRRLKAKLLELRQHALL